jgi:hypothetical protein
MSSPLVCVLATGAAVMIANAGFGAVAANLFIKAGYKFKAATWWIWFLVVLIGFSALAVSGAPVVMALMALHDAGLLAGLSDLAIGLIWPAMWLTAVFAFATAYRATIRYRLVRILDKGIAVGLH